MRKLLKNRIVLVSVIILAAVTVLSIWKIGTIQKAEGWDRDFAKSLDWVIAPGVYRQIELIEVDGQMIFCVEDIDSEERAAIDENGRTVNLKGMQRLVQNGIAYHDAGYGIVSETSAGSETFELVTVDGEVLYDSGTEEFKLSEVPGYIYFSSQENSRVVSLESGQPVYFGPEGEQVSGQKGNYWIMSVTFPWQPEINTETLYYLRNLDFSVALDGMMFNHISEIEEDMILGEVLEGYSYYGELPVYDKENPLLPVSEKVLDGHGNVLYPSVSDAACEITAAGDGWFTAAENDGGIPVERMYFFDSLREGEVLELPEGCTPWELYDEGYIEFEYYEKQGVMDRRGNIIVLPEFEYVRDLEQDCAVVVLGFDCGVIRIGGDRDEG